MRGKQMETITNQERFERNHRKYHRMISCWRFFLFLGFLALWEVCSDTGIIDSFFFSSPIGVIRCMMVQIRENHFLRHIMITLYETIISFLLVMMISLITSSALWYSPKTSKIIEPYLVILNSLPKSALAPLFIVWLGTGIKTIIIAGISVAVFGSIISIFSGFQNVDSEKLTLIYTLGGNKKDAFFKVVLPGSVPLLLSTAKVNIGLSLVGVIIGEFLAARQGLGYLIIYGSQVFQLDMVITSIIVLCIISFGLYRIIQYIEHFSKKYLQ